MNQTRPTMRKICLRQSIPVHESLHAPAAEGARASRTRARAHRPGRDCHLTSPDLRRTILTLMRVKVSQWLVVFALICAIGGHWVFLQSIAWVGMVVTYAQDATISVALKKTFDGRHPCRLCKFVEKGKESQEQPEFIKVDPKLDFWLTEPLPKLIPPVAVLVGPAGPEAAQTQCHSPPTPPPRLA